MKIAPDTNIFLHHLHILDQYDSLVYLSHVNRELEKLKRKTDELGYFARR